jgi:hypothetical protein
MKAAVITPPDLRNARRLFREGLFDWFLLMVTLHLNGRYKANVTRFILSVKMSAFVRA